MRMGSHLDCAVYCEIGQFGGEDLVIPHKWLRTHQSFIHWGENKVTFNSRYGQEHGCFITLEKELDPPEEVFALRLISLVPEALQEPPIHTRRTMVIPIMTTKLQWAIPPEFRNFKDIFSNE